MSAEESDVAGLRERAERFLVQCGPCDGGLPMGCACSTDDPRPMIAALLDEIEAARAARDAWQGAAAKASAYAEDAEAAYRAMFRQFEAMRADRDRLRAGVEALAERADARVDVDRRLVTTAALRALLPDRSAR